MLWVLLGLGIFMIYCILNFLDMIIEGLFLLGGVVCVIVIIIGVLLFIVIFLGVGVGMFVGLVIGLLFIKGKILIILVGILVMFGLNFVILFVMKLLNKFLLN